MTSPFESRNELYAALPDAVREELSSHEAAVTAPRGARLVQKGVIPDGLIILNSGTAEMTVTVEGKELSLDIAGPGKVLALQALMTEKTSDITVTCLEECRVTIVPKSTFLDMLARHPEMYLAVVRVLSKDLATADRLIRDCARGFQPKSGTHIRPV